MNSSWWHQQHSKHLYTSGNVCVEKRWRIHVFHIFHKLVSGEHLKPHKCFQSQEHHKTPASFYYLFSAVEGHQQQPPTPDEKLNWNCEKIPNHIKNTPWGLGINPEQHLFQLWEFYTINCMFFHFALNTDFQIFQTKK